MDLLTLLVLAAYAFAAGSYLFTFKYVQSVTQGLWEGIEHLRLEVRENVALAKALKENEIHHLDERITRLENQ